jgi:hypothetical protein
MVAGKLVEENKKNQITPPDDRQAPAAILFQMFQILFLANRILVL